MREQRRSRRILATIPLQMEAQLETHQAVTAVINLNGALILSPVNLPQGTALSFNNPETGMQIRGPVVWCGSPDPTGWFKLGVEFEASAPEFWGKSYDPQGTEAP
jgi:hypothetical protein